MQFHPEHMAGPADLVSLFDVFLDTVKDGKEGKVGKSGKIDDGSLILCRLHVLSAENIGILSVDLNN